MLLIFNLVIDNIKRHDGADSYYPQKKALQDAKRFEHSFQIDARNSRKEGEQQPVVFSTYIMAQKSRARRR